MNLKHLFFIFATITLLTGCLDFGSRKEYTPNSEEARKTIEWLIGAEFKGTINNSYAYENRSGIDPYYYAKFKLTDMVLSDLIDSTWSQTVLPSKWQVPGNAPNWYAPKIDATAAYYTKEFDGGSKSIIYIPENKACFLHYSTY